MRILVIGDIHGNLSKLKKEIPKHDFDFIIGIGDYAGIDEWYSYVKYYFNLKKGTKRKTAEEFFGKQKLNRLIKKDFEAGKKVLSFLDSLNKPGFFIFGNGDDDWYNYPFSKNLLKVKKRNLSFLKKIKNLKEMTYKVRNYKGISFLGFGGYMDARANDSARDKKWQKKVDKRNEKAEKKMNSLIKKFRGKSVFILHYPPLGVFDKILEKNKFYGKSTGVDFFRKAILEKNPFLVLCGHMHEYQGEKKLGNSIIVNPGYGVKGKFAIIDIDEEKGKIWNIEFYGKKKK